MGAISHSEPRVNVSLSVPRFDGPPFLTTQLESDLCNVTLLPRAPIHELLEFAFVQSTRNGLRSVLVLDAHSCVSLERSGRIQPGRTLPVDTAIVVHELETCAEIPGSDEMLERMERLAALWASQGDRTLDRDRSRGGHPATAEEIEEHAGRNPDGIPTGLGMCEECGEWTGWCLDPESDEVDRHSRLPQVRQSREHTIVPGVDNGAVLEPEIEEVAVDQQPRRRSSNLVQEATEAPLRLAGDGAKMNIGNDVDGEIAHGGAKVPARGRGDNGGSVSLGQP